MTRFPRDFLHQIKDRLSLSEIVASRIPLKKAGRAFKACCPFHDEKTPSFTVNDQKGFFHCFGCGAHGDVIEFVIKHDHLTFADAVKMLAERAGISIPQDNPETAKRDRQQAVLVRINEDASAWFHHQLSRPEHRQALHYIVKRGIGPEQIESFRLGYAPEDGRLLRNHLTECGHTIPGMIEAGVLVRSERTRNLYCPFRERIMFPVTDARGRTIAFGGRLLPDALRKPARKGDSYVPPKYLNTGDTPLFRKGRTLYGLPQAGAILKKAGMLIVVEGYTDVLACHRAGIASLAPLGTALTPEHIHQLWQTIPQAGPDETQTPILCFDGDAAGRRAAHHAAEKVLPLLTPHRSVRFAFLPQGEDPDTLLGRQGAGALHGIVARALPLNHYLWRLHTEGKRFETPESRAGLEARLHETIGTIADETVRRYYRQECDVRLARFFTAADAAPALHRHFMTAGAPSP